ncbi:TetR/AcrR family transcriptional regulator [Polyangium aurulentum]|uniref:TetR/AcrR family transcriptional regulator n=1 Tax=Polyangium aurulentum TaxID=2567896 RepID=UPI0010AE2E7E|nr:TetR/AcrR family transcriptional regulator [Polyangium aurulentum]UQA59464.1 TetR/AcrR family transcriptional regulator [Polyangium aurulentum]
MVHPRTSEHDVPSAIVASATRLFAAQGFEATSVQAVADAVGVTKQAVLHHYPSKEHLRHAVLDAIVAHWNETLPRLLLVATASVDRFDAIFGELHRFFATDADRARVVLREVLDRPAEMRRLLCGPVQPWLEAVARYIRAGQESGTHFADVDPEAYVVHVMLLGIAAAACQTVTSAVLEGDARARYDAELGRIARASLFSPRPPRAPARKSSPAKR